MRGSAFCKRLKNTEMNNGLFWWWSNEFMNDALVVQPNWVVKYKLKYIGTENKLDNKFESNKFPIYMKVHFQYSSQISV